MQENLLTGWLTYPIKLYNKSGDEISGYHGFSIVGLCGQIKCEKSKFIERRKVPSGPICQYYKGVFFDNWDGTDFFIPEGTIFIFITKNAADVLKKNNITNVELKNLDDKEIEVSTMKLLSKK